MRISEATMVLSKYSRMWGGRKKIQKKKKKRMKSLRTIQRHLLFSWYTYLKHRTKLKQTKKGKGEVPTSQSKLYITEALLLFPIVGFRNVYVFWMIAKPKLFSITIQLKEKNWYVLTAVTNTNVLTWNERLHIAVDAAHGLQINQLHDF